MESVEVGVLEQADQVSLACFLECQYSRGLELELEVLGNFTNKALEGELADEELGTLLVLADLPEGYGSGTIAVGFLDTTRGGRKLTGLHADMPVGFLPVYRSL